MIRRAKRNNENSIVIVIGCYAQTAPEEVSKIEGVNLVVGTRTEAGFWSILRNWRLPAAGEITSGHNENPGI